MPQRKTFYRPPSILLRKHRVLVFILFLNLNFHPVITPSAYATDSEVIQPQTQPQNPAAISKEEQAKAAQELYDQGMELFYQGTAESLRQARDKFQTALRLAQSVNNRTQQGFSLLGLGYVAFDLSEIQNALNYFNQARLFFKIVGERKGEALALHGIGRVCADLGENQKALDYYNQALPIFKEVRNRYGEALTLNDIGRVYSYIGETQKALDYFNQVLLFRKEVGDRKGEAIILKDIGRVYADLGETQKALDYYNQALPIHKEVSDRFSVAGILNEIGRVYAHLGERQKALDYYDRALPIYKEIGDRKGEAIIVNDIGAIYGDLGETQKALTYYNRALLIYKEIGDREGEGVILNLIGRSYSDLGETQKALDYYNQALAIRKEMGDRRGEAYALNGIGAIYADLGETQKALDYYNRALPIRKEVGDHNGEAYTLKNIGKVYASLGENQKALGFYNQALPIFKAIGNRSGEARTLNSMMYAYEALQQPRLATLFGKQSVNIYQSLRADIHGLDKEIQQTYLNSIQGAYRNLSDLLIAQGRIPEAEFVINLLKQDEYFEFVRRDNNEAKSDSRIALSPEEARLIKRYSEIADQITAIGKQLGDLRTKAEKKILTAQEIPLLTAFEKDLEAANFQFQQFLKQMAEELSKTNKADHVEVIAESQALMSDLKEIGNNTVAIYTIVSDDKYSAIIVTPDAQVARQVSIKASDLNRKITDFRAALQNPQVDPLPLAKELYKILIAPIAKDLEGAKAETLMWSLDGTLRYLPIAALHDGKQYLVEKYRNVIFTPASNARLKDAPNPTWRGLGLGMSKGNQEFSPLPAVPAELRSIIHDTAVKESQGVLEGKIIMDEGFTADTMKAALREKYPLVHIASHFRFQPGNETNSYLLLGQGVMTIAEIKRLTNLFDKVDLLTLSACNTATGGADAQGKEVEGFAVVAQRQGAKAVMATLWSVDDLSTRLLMQEFYRLRESSKGLAKVEALRQAQLALLKGKLKDSATDLTNRSPRVSDASAFKRDANAPFAHPYYWAPFILIGNAQ